MQQRRAVPWILSGTLCCTAGWAQDPPPAEVKPIVKDAVRRDRIEDRRDRREDIRDRREDVRDRKEDIRDRMEDVRDARDDARKKEALGDIDRRIRALKAEGGHPELLAKLQKRRAHLVRNIRRDRREDVRDRKEDVRDRREDVRDRKEDVRDRREDRKEHRRDVRKAKRVRARG
jgi:hypothetical protein